MGTMQVLTFVHALATLLRQRSASLAGLGVQRRVELRRVHRADDAAVRLAAAAAAARRRRRRRLPLPHGHAPALGHGRDVVRARA